MKFFSRTPVTLSTLEQQALIRMARERDEARRKLQERERELVKLMAEKAISDSESEE